jgi:hypothetical protein
MFNSPDANLAAHGFGDLIGGILGNSLKPLVQADRTSADPMVDVWALSYGLWMTATAHMLNTYGKSLEEADRYIAFVMISEDDVRIDLFTQFGTNDFGAIHAILHILSQDLMFQMKFFVAININDLPECLKQTQVHSDMAKLKMDADREESNCS